MKKLSAFLSAFVLSISSLVTLISPHAFAATRTWDGGGSDNNMMTDENWAGDTAPSAGDDLVFPANITKLTVTNDFTAATSFHSITFSGAATQDSNYILSGNSITLVAGITNSMTGSFNTSQTIDFDIALNGTQTFETTSDRAVYLSGDLNLGSSALTVNTGDTEWDFSGIISGTTGSLTKDDDGYLVLTSANTFDGDVIVNAGYLVARNDTALGSTNGDTTVASGAGLIFVHASGEHTVHEALTLNGTGPSDFGALGLQTSWNSGGPAAQPPYATSEFDGDITLGSNASVRASQRTVKFSGGLSGSHTLSLVETSLGILIIDASPNTSSTANATLEPPVKETTYSDDQAGVDVNVNYNETVILSGKRGDITIAPKGTLKGTGTAGNVTVIGTIAPGNSPGCLNTSDLTFITGAVYQFEVGGTTACTDYDQINVTGTVVLDGTLEASLYNNFKPTAGQKYVIINNDGSDQVSGTFSGLEQGAKFVVGDYQFSISYTGGDGNDVELTVLGSAPDTGFALIKSNPFVSMGLMLTAALAIAYAARRNKLAGHRR